MNFLLDTSILIHATNAPYKIKNEIKNFHHKDPFDRMLIAQAACEDYTILTSDKQFEKYQVNVIINLYYMFINVNK